ncbi:MAG: TetR/AcrR family transcriptional regulator [Gammaproteobacteria bacterium]|nr:MAG: TetR/AcrR family transcriptional regulator [Gammaproteobacteria bacterium]UCH40304.1 MAG: TetR/AcrR family transcriptional regulator [Gammaproteobacteria bacterium]
MARPREFNEEQVIENLMKVFWDKGYEATTMSDLVNASGLLKGSLYGAFGDKHALYMAALRHYDRTRIQAGIDMLNGEGTARQKIARLFDNVIESTKRGLFAGGCLLCNASLEMAATDRDIKNEVKTTIRRLKVAIMEALQPQVENEDQAASLAAFIVSAYFGTRVLAKGGAPAAMIGDTRDHCLQLIP